MATIAYYLLFRSEEGLTLETSAQETVPKWKACSKILIETFHLSTSTFKFVSGWKMFKLYRFLVHCVSDNGEYSEKKEKSHLHYQGLIWPRACIAARTRNSVSCWYSVPMIISALRDFLREIKSFPSQQYLSCWSNFFTLKITLQVLLLFLLQIKANKRCRMHAYLYFTRVN